jgi:hypothetical protein
MTEMPTGRLGSWTAIATYLDCSVRTVRRWERAEGLPVHRHVHQKLGRVFAQCMPGFADIMEGHLEEAIDPYRTPMSQTPRISDAKYLPKGST